MKAPNPGFAARLVLLVLLTLAFLSGCGRAVDWQSRWEEVISGAQVTAEQLIVRCEEFLAEEPPRKYVSQAQFTIGFTWAESLEKFDEARRWFEQLLEEDPDCEWADDARWMLENMEKDVEDILPQLEQVPPPR
jgi:hypothetical protein